MQLPTARQHVQACESVMTISSWSGRHLGSPVPKVAALHIICLWAWPLGTQLSDDESAGSVRMIYEQVAGLATLSATFPFNNIQSGAVSLLGAGICAGPCIGSMIWT